MATRSKTTEARALRRVFRLAPLAPVVLIGTGLASPGLCGDDSKPLSREQASQLKNPAPYTPASVARGKAVYLRHCSECHDADGRALSNTMYEAADLTAPESWTYGTTDGEIFMSIREGAGDDMPPYKDTLKKEEDIWHVVNFLRSLGPQSLQPGESRDSSPE